MNAALRECSVEGCHRRYKALGLCKAHYDRQWANRPIGAPIAPPTTAAERFAGGLVEQANGCIEWALGTNFDGYGYMNANGNRIFTHRFAWELANGPITGGLHVLHHCDNPPCCNVEHLFLGTHADNAADMIAKGRNRNGNEVKTRCPAGHEYDADNTYVNSGTNRRSCRACHKIHQRNYLARKATA